MMLFKLSLKNIRKSFRDYAVYFFTLIVGVSIFYVFNSLDSQTAMMKLTENSREIIDLMVSTLSGVSVFVSFVLGFLIVYASGFLMKRRNREFGIYLTLGMGKRKISMILFFETLFIGMISLVAGLAAGAGLSQLMSAFVANMFDADMTSYKFVFSAESCKKTILYFGIMYVVVMVFNTINISRCKLIDLLQAGKRSEQLKLKNPWLCVLVFIFASVMLGRAYYMVASENALAMLQTTDEILIPIAMGIAATVLIFWSLSGLLLRIVMSMKGVYYRGLNSFILRQLSSRINSTVGSMSVICLMLFVTICILSAGLSVRNSLTMQLEEMAPMDCNIIKKMGEDGPSGRELTTEELAGRRLSIEEFYDTVGIDVWGNLKDVVIGHYYQDETLTLGVTLGELLDEVMENFRFLSYDIPEDIVKLSDYNAVAVVYGNETYSLAADEYMIVANFHSMVDVRNQPLSVGQEIRVFGSLLKPKYTECQEGCIEMGANHTNAGFIVVPDEVVEGQTPYQEYILADYAGASDEEKEKIEKLIIGAGKVKNWENKKEDNTVEVTLPEGTGLKVPTEALEASTPDINTRMDIATASVGLGGIMAFVGLYLGLVFLISGAAILALKELSDSADNRERYAMLRKLGVDEAMINRAIFTQILIFFLAPLLLAAIHSVFGIKFSVFILETFGTDGLLHSILTTVVILLLIYGSYFLLTYFSSKNIIKGK